MKKNTQKNKKIELNPKLLEEIMNNMLPKDYKGEKFRFPDETNAKFIKGMEMLIERNSKKGD